MKKSDLENIEHGQAMLDHLDSRITEKLAEIAQALRSVLSIRIATELPSGGWLIFGKWGGVWSFLYKDAGYESVPLASAPRDIRCSMLVDGHVQRLIGSAIGTIANEIGNREKALAAADVALALFKENKS